MFKWFLSCLFHRPNLDESVKAVNPILHFIDKSPVLKLERNSILGRIIRFTFHLHTRRISLSYSQICRHVMLVVRKLINFDTRFFQTNYDSLCCESKIVTLAHKNRLPLKLSSPILFIYIFMYLRSPILGRVTTTALGAKYCWPVTVLPPSSPSPMRETTTPGTTFQTLYEQCVGCECGWGLWDGPYGLSSLSEKTRKPNLLHMSLQRQHFLLSVGPAVVWISSIPLGVPALI